MQTIQGTRPHECTECRKETVVVKMERADDQGRTADSYIPPMNGQLKITTECAGCQIQYTHYYRTR